MFLSVVVVLRDRSAELPALLGATSAALGELVGDHELVVIDNGSQDDSVAALKRLAAEDGLPNLQVYALTKEVDVDTASWAGLENALGDFVAVYDPSVDDLSFLATMLESATAGADMVFASNRRRPPQTLSYRLAARAFDAIYRWSTGVDLRRDAPQFRILSRRVVNFILQHPQPAVAYRHLPASAGFARASLSYEAVPREARPKRLGESIERGVRLLVATTRAPMRLVTALSLFGALANLAYSVYVIGVALLKEDVAPGWVTLSLQQSGMFLLLSLVLLVLGEYILQMATLSNEGPLYHVAQEFTSARLTRRERLNVVDGDAAPRA
jgi:glycosyltransferase involved in cell wall biosynthesis